MSKELHKQRDTLVAAFEHARQEGKVADEDIKAARAAVKAFDAKHGTLPALVA